MIREPAGETRIWYESVHDISPIPEAFLAATILPAMALGATIRVEAPVSPLFLSNLLAIQNMLAAWYFYEGGLCAEPGFASNLAFVRENSTISCFRTGG